MSGTDSVVFAAAFAVACGGGGGSHPAGSHDAGAEGAAGSGGVGADIDAEPDAVRDATPDAELPVTPWGPSFVGVAENVDGTTPHDLALGFFWNPSVVTVEHVGADCVGFRFPEGAPAGFDVGEVVVEGGSVASPTPLSRDDGVGSYSLQSPGDAWSPGDQLSLSVQGRTLGPLRVPSPFASESLSTLTTVNRDGPLPVVFSGSDADQVAVSLSGGDGTNTYLLICIAQAAPGSFAVPADAMASIPPAVARANVKLSPLGFVQVGDLAFLVGGQAAEIDADIAQ